MRLRKATIPLIFMLAGCGLETGTPTSSAVQQQQDEYSSDLVYYFELLREQGLEPPEFPKLRVSDLSTGAIGGLVGTGRILQVVSASEFLVDFDGQTVWFSGMTTFNVVDGQRYSFENTCILCIGRRQYETVLGARKTVFAVRRFDLQEAEALWPGYIRQQQMRRWTDNSGDFSAVARFLKFEQVDGVSTVFLDREDGGEISVPMDRLSDADQKFVRETLKANAESRRKRRRSR